MNTRRAALITDQFRSVAPPRARHVPVSWRGAAVLCGVIASTSVCLTVRAACDDPDDPDDEVAGAAVRRFVLSEQQFDQLVFGGDQRVVRNGGNLKVSYGEPSATAVWRRMETLLENEIRSVDARCGLSEAQKKKLQLAGRGDITRLLNRVAELRRKCTAGPMDQMQYNAIMVEVQSLSLRNAPQFGPFGESSLLQKILRKTLTDEQLVQFRDLSRERLVQAVENALRAWPAQAELVGENRKKFIDTLVDHGSFPQTNSPYMQYIVWFEASRIEDRLKPLFNETQWQWFQQQVTNVRRVEPALRQRGLWPTAPPTDDESTPDDAKD